MSFLSARGDTYPAPCTRSCSAPCVFGTCPQTCRAPASANTMCVSFWTRVSLEMDRFRGPIFGRDQFALSSAADRVRLDSLEIVLVSRLVSTTLVKIQHTDFLKSRSRDSAARSRDGRRRVSRAERVVFRLRPLLETRPAQRSHFRSFSTDDAFLKESVGTSSLSAGSFLWKKSLLWEKSSARSTSLSSGPSRSAPQKPLFSLF